MLRLLNAFLVASLSTALAAEAGFKGPLNAGAIEGPPRQETSGMAFSRRTAGLVWTHDDSGGSPQLFGDDLATGKRRGVLRLAGVKNEDWEDLAAFERDGRAWLLVGDVGDNDAKRRAVRMHLVEEPPATALRTGGPTDVTPAYTIDFRFVDGPRDCEGLAVDAAEGMVYLVTKRERTPRLYRVPLADPRGRLVEAAFVTEIAGVSTGERPENLIKRLAGPRFNWPTAMDFSADGRAAVVLTYGEPLVFAREGGQPWAEVFKRPPARLGFHGFPQAEAVTFSLDGRSVYVASESTPALVRYDRE